MWSSGQGSSKAAVRKRAQLRLYLHPFSLWSKDDHHFLNNRNSIKAPVLDLHQWARPSEHRSNRSRLRLFHLSSRVELYTHLTPVTTRGFQEDVGQGPALQPSTNGDFSVCVLVWNLVLDLICVPWVTAGHGADRGRVPATFNHPSAGLHLHVQASLHAAHLHVLVQMSVHIALCCSQFQLESENMQLDMIQTCDCHKKVCLIEVLATRRAKNCCWATHTAFMFKAKKISRNVWFHKKKHNAQMH